MKSKAVKKGDGAQPGFIAVLTNAIGYSESVAGIAHRTRVNSGGVETDMANSRELCVLTSPFERIPVG